MMSNLGGRLDLATAMRLVAIRRQHKGFEQTGAPVAMLMLAYQA
jgi:hypothetical protein